MNASLVRNKFRTCPETGLKVYKPAQKLMWANAVTAVVFIATGGILALFIALHRAGWYDLSQVMFYRFITVHGTDMLVFWMVFFEMAGLIFGSSVILKARYPAIKWGWFNYALMLIGALMLNIVVFFGGTSDIMFTAYPPLKASPWFYLGIVLFAVGTLSSVIQFFYALVVAKKEGWYKGSLPLFTYGLAVAGIIAVFTLVSGAIAFVPALIWSLPADFPILGGLIPKLDPAFFRLAFWGFGHSAQQINLAATVSIWYMLGTLTVGAKPVNQKLSRLAFILYIVGINLGSVHHILVDPGFSSTYRIFNTSYLAYAAVLGSLIHAFSIPASVEVAQRAKGFTKGLFQWIVKAPWSNPGFSGLVLSFVIFGFLGGVTGIIMSVEQLNMIQHNTLRVPGHFHAIVVGGSTLAFMSLTYYFIPLVLQRKISFKRLAKYQPFVFALGIILLSAGMHFAGVMGAPRRHWDVKMTNAIFQAPFSAGMYTMLGLLGVGGITAFTGLYMFVTNAVVSVFFGKKIATIDEPYEPEFAKEVVNK